MSSIREINIKNHGCCYPDGIINVKDLDLDKISVFEKYIFIYHVACKTSYGGKNLWVLVFMQELD